MQNLEKMHYYLSSDPFDRASDRGDDTTDNDADLETHSGGTSSSSSSSRTSPDGIHYISNTSLKQARFQQRQHHWEKKVSQSSPTFYRWLVLLGTFLFCSSISSDESNNKQISITVQAFSSAMSVDYSLNRFRVSCPADVSCIRRFDPNLLVDETQGGATVGDGKMIENEDSDTLWVAVYRSSNNKPSIFVRDDFFQAMDDATSLATTSANTDTPTSANSQPPEGLESLPASLQQEKPVAVARLIQSKDFDSSWVLDNMRCSLRKEDIDESCDGGSEFVEAISICVDALLLQHLQQNVASQKLQQESNDDDGDDDNTSVLPPPVFEGVIRTKATIHSSKLLEARGFEPVEELSKDMATHVSAYDACMENYAKRTVSTVSKNPGTRDRALQMVSLLGKLDRDYEMDAAAAIKRQGRNAMDDGDDEGDECDPWAGFSKLNL